MKEINLPLTQTFSAVLDLNSIKREYLVDLGDGMVGISFGELVNDEISRNMVQARKNGGEVLYATTSIEKQIENILLVYFMGKFEGQSTRRELFEQEVLQSTALSFSAKKELITKVIHSDNIFYGKFKSKLQKQLKDILTWRNAFAHGKIEHNTTLGCIIKYYSNGSKVIELTDDFWLVVEGTFNETSHALNEVKSKLEEIF